MIFLVYHTVYKILNLFLPPCPPAVPDSQHQMVIKTHTRVLPVGKNGEVGSQGEGEVRRGGERGFWRSYKEDGEEGKAEEIEVGRDKKICQWNDRQERGN